MRSIAVLLFALFALTNAITTINQYSKFTDASYTPQELMGESVAISGNLVVVGAPQRNNHQGVAFVYNCPSGGCTLVTTLVSPNPVDEDQFGFSVAISGNTVVVGSPFKSVNGNDFQGTAYVFSCTASGCGSAITLTQPTGAAYDDFGTAVAVSGNLVIVGADQRTVNSNLGQGSVYVFTCSGGSCGTPSILDCDDCSGGGENFGKAVSVSGNIVAVGAPFRSLGANGQQGQGYVFDCTNPASCSLISHAVANDGADSDNFATSVSISGWTVAFGSPYANGTYANQGAVYMFSCTSSQCIQSSKILTSVGAAGDSYGFSVSLNFARLVVGAPGKTVNGLAGRGAAYFHDCSDPSACVEVREFHISDYTTDPDGVGFSVATTTTFAVVGVPYHKTGASSAIGAIYLYSLPAITCPPLTEDNAYWSRTTISYSTYGTCLTGYFGSPSRVCQANSTFGPITNPCRQIVAFCPKVTYAYMDWPQTNPGTTANALCQNGYTGSGTRQCLNAGWSTSVTGTCTRLTCPGGAFDNADYPTTNSLTSANGVCQPGYVGTPTRYCNGTGWGAVSNPCIIGKCSEGQYGTAYFPEAGANTYSYGTCQSGWSGHPARKCLATGAWSSSVTNLCTRNVCKGTSTGNADFPDANSFQQVAGTCHPNFSGAPRLYCNADGTWAPVTNPCT